ncbi:hypothetical protein RO3G_01706 [Rhizopus delemar RA 99-880]|uniref:Uncharacterized protein n=1 Tax=Rhizopus delemar (strain RA 99-880 / ATCC MYA-4621 / FGSC 9543 / NRRL 43880) TaxID=246409 RepID=I1BLC2_RHIO9|nr:hypothetical protein RO3G_01706 [Rhizopus delemar RA 99-880]|eukprot:EIE77002.1 hypothetical protein RO3G_01706 [Rhizopus delemar RA 99-880]
MIFASLSFNERPKFLSMQIKAGFIDKNALFNKIEVFHTLKLFNNGFMQSDYSIRIPYCSFLLAFQALNRTNAYAEVHFPLALFFPLLTIQIKAILVERFILLKLNQE